ncbi:MAG TPA: serine/threonine-protein kinase, partial [Pyrinomonadaceae bacterium]|nr:serine/threonine-protein kinase [Pyrinomonadaceae bacterium]
MKKCPKCEKSYEDTVTLCPIDGTVLEKPDDGLVGQTLADKYRVEEFLSHGGMGTVYRGTHILMDKTVAIKVLHPSLAADDKIVARFSREARAASRISHPHALNVTDFGESQNGVVFLVMEYLHGKTLKEVIHANGPMPLPRVIEIIRQVCGALDAAHGEGVVHRDLKSDNIMLIDVGGGDWAKVLDFGIAKIKEPVGGTDPALTSPNLIIGTPQYMSPEQCSQAAELDARSDIYSLGVILYELLVGRVPFTGESPTAIMMKHLQEPAPSVLDERKDVPAEVGRVVSRAMAKRPEDRFQSAGELSEALSLAAEGKVPAVAATTAAGAAENDRATNRI